MDEQEIVERRYREWLEKADDDAVRRGLTDMQADAKKRTDSFYKDLEFGTGGLRGILGAGTNCLNIYTVRKATMGVCAFMHAHGMARAAISCDSRINSDVFKECAAAVFASEGIECIVTKTLMPVPFLSFLTRETQSDIGVMITASHNPKAYNGYKVYGADGCQLTDDAANEVTGFIAPIDPFSVRPAPFSDYVASGKIKYANECLTERFLCAVESTAVDRADGLKVAFSPLNGAGYKLVPEILRRMGVAALHTVPEQAEPDGNFTTCPYPNPEKPAALELGLKLAKEKDTDVLIATDPDCDRMGCAVKTATGEYTLLTGNEVGVLLCDYLLARKRENGTLPNRPIVVKTIVTSDMACRVAEPFGAEVREVLTGFKYIGDVVGKLEKAGQAHRFILGFEESYGYSSGTYVRDKDGVNAAMQLCCMAAYYKKLGWTLVQRLQTLYATYGTYRHELMSFEFPGASGSATMRGLLSDLRQNPPAEIAGLSVESVTDYLTEAAGDLPRANVLSYALNGGSKVIVRPSGTEPLIKLYLTVSGGADENETRLAGMRQALNGMFNPV